jgi:dienelactone hydrolase
MYFYGDYLAQRGYIVFAPNIEHEYLEGITKTIHWGPLPKEVKFPWMGQRVWMIKRAIDFLLTQPGIDPDKIAVVGLSNGGVTAMYVGAFDQRIKLTIASGSLILYDRMWHKELIHCRCQYLYKMEGLLDYYDVFALVAPRALVVQNGFEDPIFPVQSSVEAFEYIKKAYLIDNATDRLMHDIHNGKHEFRMEIPIGWFNRFLYLVKRGIAELFFEVWQGHDVVVIYLHDVGVVKPGPVLELGNE